MKPWRNSASLIALSVDGKLIVQERSSRSSAFPSSTVFPGGGVDRSDDSTRWLDHLRSFGFGSDHFARLLSPLHSITADGRDPLLKNISLRITAIRETFEESGILVCRKRNTVTDLPWATSLSDFDIQSWQEKVNKDAGNFLKLCRTLDCYPDIWSLYLWSNWLTPVNVTRTRFNTVFFIAAFEEQPLVYADSKEVATLNWSKPIDLLRAYENNQITMEFPQWYETTRLSKIENIQSLMDFARARSSRGCTLVFPCLQFLSDGMCVLLPDDEDYPADPDFVNGGIIKNEETSIRERFSAVKVAHRVELHEAKYKYFTKNYVPSYNHISISDSQIPNLKKITKSLL